MTLRLTNGERLDEAHRAVGSAPGAKNDSTIKKKKDLFMNGLLTLKLSLSSSTEETNAVFANPATLPRLTPGGHDSFR